MEDPSIDIIFNIAATPKGVANYYTHHVVRLRGESQHSLSLICSSPRYVAGTPKGGSLASFMLTLFMNINAVIKH